MTADRCVTLDLSESELRDIEIALKQRISAIADARPGFRCQMQARAQEAADRIIDLQVRIDLALKRLAKMPGGDR